MLFRKHIKYQPNGHNNLWLKHHHAAQGRLWIGVSCRTQCLFGPNRLLLAKNNNRSRRTRRQQQRKQGPRWCRVNKGVGHNNSIHKAGTEDRFGSVRLGWERIAGRHPDGMRSPDLKRPTQPAAQTLGNGNLCKYPYSLDFHVNSMGPWDMWQVRTTFKLPIAAISGQTNRNTDPYLLGLPYCLCSRIWQLISRLQVLMRSSVPTVRMSNVTPSARSANIDSVLLFAPSSVESTSVNDSWTSQWICICSSRNICFNAPLSFFPFFAKQTWKWLANIDRSTDMKGANWNSMEGKQSV